MHARLIALPLLAALSPAPAALAQGEFVNFETPQTKPIAVATLGSGANLFDVVLVCNTPDNSVEIYRADPPFTFLRRVAVGLGPGTVKWNAALGRFFTCNFDGDSVTDVALAGTLSGGTVSISASIQRTTAVGDQPSDIAFDPTNTYAFVTLSSRGGYAWIRTSDLAPVASLVVPTVTGTANPPIGVKMPRRTEMLPDGRLFLLDMLSDDGVDLMVEAGAVRAAVGPLGNTHHSFAFANGNARMFIVGTRAMRLPTGEPAALAQPFGFYESWLWVVDTPSGLPAQVAGEALAGAAPGTLWKSVNLNKVYATGNPVPVADALSQPTDVLVYETPAAFKVFVTAFHSDKVARLQSTAAQPSGWATQVIGLGAPLASYSMVGPRGFALSTRAKENAAAAAGLLFVANRLDNSVSVINPNTDLLASPVSRFALHQDPTPQPIREGREFLYGAKHSGSGFVSCASCHIDATTDGLIWDLSSSESITVPAQLHDHESPVFTTFPQPKSIMVTQTLQGLVNAPLEPSPNFSGQELFSNAPYHWRGDRGQFTDFNGAFPNLLGRQNPLSIPEMAKYTRFIETVMHPPNPEQFLDRKPGGTLNTTNPDSLVGASGQLLGMLLFHDVPFPGLAGRSCVHCHVLPDGSSNTLVLPAVTGSSVFGPSETAALRNLFQREGAVPTGFTDTITAKTKGTTGLGHAGDMTSASSINRFLTNFFLSGMPGPNQQQQIEAVIEFVRRFDSGIAPAAGFAYTLTPNAAQNSFYFDLLEGQVAEANIGLAVYAQRIDPNTGTALEEGYWYDVTAAGYRLEGTATVVPRGTLDAAAAAGGVVILQGTPAGSERRIANLAGVRTPLSGPAPSLPWLAPMAPPTQWADVTRFTLNTVLNTDSTQPGPLSTVVSRLDTFMSALIAASPTFGVTTLSMHQPPRRFRVIGNDIRPGAYVLIGLPKGAPMSNPQYLRIPVFPTSRFATNPLNSQSQRIWESTLELDPLWTMALLNGGPEAPGVKNVMTLSNVPPLLQPVQWNAFDVRVVNEDGTFNGGFSWRSLTVQNGR